MKILQQTGKQVNRVVALNKIDRMHKSACLPVMEKISRIIPDIDIIPVSALKKDNIEQLETYMINKLPPGLPHFADDQLTDKSMRFIAAEIIREKLFRVLTQEVPYSITVAIDHYQEEDDLTRISATIWVERKSQKAIVIGKQGAQLKKIGGLARADIEQLVNTKVYLQLWAKVRQDWADDEHALAAFGYCDANQSR